ncbi:MAG: hypothetical protein JWM00_124 [Candidatus Saccharibacteria bacterium]|nr:hypothetical protein [Candidatus Saccharibacteria bacterium]
MKKLQTIISSMLITIGVLAVPMVVGVTNAGAVCDSTSSARDCIEAGSDIKTGSGNTSLVDQIKTVVNILLFILGAIAVIMIIVGGIRYTTSNGDSSAITSAKNTILYSIVGLVVALLAYAIVNFVLIQFA